MLSKQLSRIILIGGVIHFIGSFLNYFYGDFANLINIFCIIHAFITILAGYLLLKRKEIGKFFLLLSVLMFILTIAIPVEFRDLGGNPQAISLFLVTISLLIFIPFANPIGIIVPILAFFYIYAVFNGFLNINKKKKKQKIILIVLLAFLMIFIYRMLALFI